MLKRKPVLCVVAGPNGSGKTSTTVRLFSNEWASDLSISIRMVSPRMVLEIGTPKMRFGITSLLGKDYYLFCITWLYYAISQKFTFHIYGKKI